MAGLDMKMLRLVVRHELRVLMADRTLWIVSLILLALVGYGLYNGAARVERDDKRIAELLDTQAKAQPPLLEQLKRITAGQEQPEPFANPADPSNMGSGLGARWAVMPAAPLAAAAVGQSDLFPNHYQVTYRSKIRFIHDTEIENPWNLLSGNFDLAFVIIYLLPLMIFALCHNLLALEREQGTLKILLSQPLGLLTLVAGKVAVRAAALMVPAVLIPVVALAALRAGSAGGVPVEPLAWWAALVIGYAAFWFAGAVWVNTLGKSSAANAVILMCAWAVLVLIAPVVLNLLVSLASPVPSRTELATRTRVVTTEVLNRYAHLLRVDYNYVNQPQVLVPKDGKIDVPSRMRAFYKMNADVDREIQPDLDRFETQLAKQHHLVNTIGFISPAIVAFEGMTDLAGTGARRYAHFMGQIDAHHRAWKSFFIPKIDASRAIAPEDFDMIPNYTWREEPASVMRSHALIDLMQILLPVAALAALALWRIRRYSVV